MIMQKERQLQRYVRDMNRFFAEADDSGDGLLSLEEFQNICKDPRVKSWLAAMDLDASNAESVFELIEGLAGDGDNRLSAEELVHGVARIKGAARSIDLLTMQRKLDMLERTCQRIDNTLSMNC